MSQQMPPQGAYAPGTLLPPRTRARLTAMRGDATHRGFSTSDLSVNEFVLTREAGFEPIGLVMGSSIYHVGWQMTNWKQSQEVGVLMSARATMGGKHTSSNFSLLGQPSFLSEVIIPCQRRRSPYR